MGEPVEADQTRRKLKKRADARHYHMTCLLHRIGAELPNLLEGTALAQASCRLEQACWRELGHVSAPIFEGDLPPFLMADAEGKPHEVVAPMPPEALAARLAVSNPPMPGLSSICPTFDALSRLLGLSPCELQWLRWADSVRYFGRAMLPTIQLENEAQGCYLLALLSEMPLEAFQEATASRRLYTWGFLDGCGADGGMPSSLAGWLSATDLFVELTERPHANDVDLLTTLCRKRGSLSASC